jgi:di/tricarboxylate transporter
MKLETKILWGLIALFFLSINLIATGKAEQILLYIMSLGR